MLVLSVSILAVGIWGLPLATASVAVAPILIHLLNRLRFDRIRWAAMEFLLASRKRNRRRMQLEQMLLLLLRVLIMLLLTAAFARIAWGPEPTRATTAAEGGPETHIVLLDAGMSMGASTAGGAGSGLATGVRHVQELVRRLRAGDHFALVLVGRTAELDRPLGPMAEGDAETVIARLAELRPTDTDADHAAALDLLYRAADRSESGLLMAVNPKHALRIHIVSDLRAAAWGGDRTGRIAAGLARVRERFRADIQVADVAVSSPPRPGNLAVTGFAARETELTVFRGSTVPADRELEFLAEVTNFGAEPATARLEVFVDGRKMLATSEINIPAGQAVTEPLKLKLPGQTRSSFGLRPPPRPAEAAVVLTGRGGGDPLGDALSADNRRYLGLRVVEDGLRVLLVTGDVSPREVEDGIALPLLAALAPPPREGDTRLTPAAISVVHQSEDMLRQDAGDDAAVRAGLLRAYDAVIFSNVGTVPPNLIPEIARFVRSGGLLVLFPGDRTRTAVWNEDFFRRDQRLLPAALQSPVDAIRVEGRTLSFAVGRFADEHPLWADLRGFPEPLGPVGVSVFRYVPMQAGKPDKPTGSARDSPLDSARDNAELMPPEKPGNNNRGNIKPGNIKPERPMVLGLEEGVTVLARYNDRGTWHDGLPGSPAVIERRFGQGRVIVFASAAGPPWNDWATDSQRRGSFLVMVQGLMQTAVPERVAAVTAGEPFRARLLPPAVGSERFRLAGELTNLSLSRRADPTARQEWISVSDFVAERTPGQEGAVEARFRDTRYAGVYRIGSAGGTAIEMFAVNPVRAVSDLTRLGESERRSLFPDADVRAAGSDTTASPEPVFNEIDDSDDSTAGDLANPQRPAFTLFDQYVVQWLLGTMMFLMVVETLLSQRFAHYQRA